MTGAHRPGPRRSLTGLETKLHRPPQRLLKGQLDQPAAFFYRCQCSNSWCCRPSSWAANSALAPVRSAMAAALVIRVVLHHRIHPLDRQQVRPGFRMSRQAAAFTASPLASHWRLLARRASAQRLPGLFLQGGHCFAESLRLGGVTRAASYSLSQVCKPRIELPSRVQQGRSLMEAVPVTDRSFSLCAIAPSTCANGMAAHLTSGLAADKINDILKKSNNNTMHRVSTLTNCLASQTTSFFLLHDFHAL